MCECDVLGVAKSTGQARQNEGGHGACGAVRGALGGPCDAMSALQVAALGETHIEPLRMLRALGSHAKCAVAGARQRRDTRPLEWSSGAVLSRENDGASSLERDALSFHARLADLVENDDVGQLVVNELDDERLV